MKTHSQTILITGGGSGIGLALAHALLDEGNTVIIAGRSAEKLEAVRAKRPTLQTLPLDLANESSITNAANEVGERWPKLSILINNAGVMNIVQLNSDTVLKTVRSEVETNLLGPLSLTHKLIPILWRAPEAAIVNVSSGVAWAPMPAAPGYSATKAALHSFTQSMRYQLRDTPIKVFEVMPPVVDTGMPDSLQGTGRTAKRMRPEQLAHEVVRGLQSDRLEMRIGVNRLMYWMMRIAPGLVERELQRM